MNQYTRPYYRYRLLKLFNEYNISYESDERIKLFMTSNAFECDILTLIKSSELRKKYHKLIYKHLSVDLYLMFNLWRKLPLYTHYGEITSLNDIQNFLRKMNSIFNDSLSVESAIIANPDNNQYYDEYVTEKLLYL